MKYEVISEPLAIYVYYRDRLTMAFYAKADGSWIESLYLNESWESRAEVERFISERFFRGKSFEYSNKG